MNKEQTVKGTKILSFLKKIGHHYPHQPNQTNNTLININHHPNIHQQIPHKIVPSSHNTIEQTINSHTLLTKTVENS